MMGRLERAIRIPAKRSFHERRFRTFVILLGTLATTPACQPETAPETPPFVGQNPTSSLAQRAGSRASDHASANTGQQSEVVQKQEDLQTALEFAKSELGRFEAALKERQQLSHQRMTSAQLKIDEQQRKINSFAAKMSSGTLTPQESLELEQARRDKADAEKQLAAEKDVKGINEKPIEALMQAKREEISRIEADLQALAGMDTATP